MNPFVTINCYNIKELVLLHFIGQNGKYWRIDGEGIAADSDTPVDGFYIELREPTRICLRSKDGRYLGATKNGTFKLVDTGFDTATQWEY